MATSSRLLSFYILLATPMSIVASSCGELITYNQYSDILIKAPTCFKNGCGNVPVTSMSSPCDPKAACYPLWQIMNQEHQKEKEWCSNCHEDDVACRISGWPVLNATEACDMSPNSWLFGNGCCVNGDEPRDLSSWVESLCNNSWREQFVPYAGFAKRDWPDWELPWNWTVAPDNTVNPDCPAMSRYLGLFVIENFVFLVFVCLYQVVLLWEIRGRQNRRPFVWLVLTILLPLKKTKDGIEGFLKWCFSWTKDSGKGNGAVVSVIAMSIFFSGIQLGFNFASAYVVKRQPGYQHVPAPLLALLFCCRPRIGFLACLLSKTPDPWLIKHFHLSPPRNALDPNEPNLFLKGQQAVAKVAIGSALGEVIMQCLGSYFLGKTAHVGVNRGFYLAGHLIPFWRGGPAHIMYIGAMFWVSASIFIVLVWIVVVITHAEILRFFAVTESWLKRLIADRVSAENTPRRVEAWIGPVRYRNPPQQGPSESSNLIRDPSNQIIRPGSGNRGNRNSGHILRPGLRGGAISPSTGASSSTSYDALPLRDQDFPSGPSSSITSGNRPRNSRNGYQAVPVIPEMVQVGNQPYDPPEENFRGRDPPEENFRVRDVPEENFRGREPLRQNPFADPQDPGHIHRRDPRPGEGEDPGHIHRRDPRPGEGEDPGYIHRVNRREDQYRDTAYQGFDAGTPANADDSSDSSPYNATSHFPRTLREWQPWVLFLGVALGLISYVAQWLFWGGFVHAAGERFCPPRLGITGTLWSFAGVFGLGAIFGLG